MGNLLTDVLYPLLKSLLLFSLKLCGYLADLSALPCYTECNPQPRKMRNDRIFCRLPILWSFRFFDSSPCACDFCAAYSPLHLTI